MQGRCRAHECWRRRRRRSWRGPGAGGLAPVLALAQVVVAGRGCRSRCWRGCRSWPQVRLPVLAQRRSLVVLAQVPVVAGAGGAVPVQRLLSRQSFSAAMARTTP